MKYLGIDLAWGEGSEAKQANRSGVVALDAQGNITDAGWTVGLDETLAWIDVNASPATVLFVDAPLVVSNLTKQRVADKQVGQRYGKWLVSANSVNVKSTRKAGVHLRELLETAGWGYGDGRTGPPSSGRSVSECYPYTALVGAEEFGYPDKRPAYKRKPKRMTEAEFKPIRRKNCDELIQRVADLCDADPPIDLNSHPTTGQLVNELSPESPSAYKKREDLLDAAICAWTAALWHTHGLSRCQVLGGPEHDGDGVQLATMIAPARDEQRRDSG